MNSIRIINMLPANNSLTIIHLPHIVMYTNVNYNIKLGIANLYSNHILLNNSILYYINEVID